MGAANGATDVTFGAPTVRRLDLGRFRASHAVFDGSHRIPSHYHERGCLSVVLSGRFVQRFPGKEMDCGAHGVLVKPPGERHDDRWCGAVTRHVIVEPDPDRHDELGEEAAAMFSRVVFRHDPPASSVARELARELGRSDPARELAVEALVLELIVRLARASEPEGATPSWLAHVRDALHDRYAEPVRLQDLAAAAGVHPSRLSRSFRAHFGMAPGAYLRTLRLAAAQRDLAGSTRPIAEVAVRHSFTDQSHLTRALKRRTGVTPAVYRARS